MPPSPIARTIEVFPAAARTDLRAGGSNTATACDCCNSGLQVDDILQPNAVDMMIFVLYLYTTLPQLIPKSSVIFCSKLLETQVRSRESSNNSLWPQAVCPDAGSCLVQVCHVQLSNPGPRQLTYTARLDGPIDFSLDVQEVKLGAKASQRLPIMCTPSTTKPQVSTLPDLGGRPSHRQASCLGRADGPRTNCPLQHATDLDWLMAAGWPSHLDE